MDAAKSPPVRPGSYTLLFLLFASVILLTHVPWLGLPYFWDEAGYYVPAALDLFHGGSPVPHSVPPVVHPPALSAYLAAVWSITGFHAESTRCAMLLLAAAAALLSLLLAIELLRDAPGMPAFLTAGMVCLSPVFFAQALLAQPDMPAMLFTTLALWFFLRERIVLAAAACIVLVLVKETGIVAPIVFTLWLAYERRWRDAAWFLAPLAALAAWIAILTHATGHWAGTPAFAEYNLFYPLHPLRAAVNALRRVYYLFFANLHWIGAFAVLFAWRTSRIFRTRNWRIAGSLAIAHAVTVTLLGGATLERYLLPVLPILYSAMTAGLSLFPRKPRLICSGALLVGLMVGIFVNPPYPFPYEDNLAFADFVDLQREAADYLARSYSGVRVATVWPLSIELARPELGYADRRLAVESLPDLTPETLRRVDWRKIQILAAFSRNWDPTHNPLRNGPLSHLWQAIFGYAPFAGEEEVRQDAPYPPAAHWQKNGQWMDIYVNPRQPLTAPGKPLRAER
jgi:4-amino-4-deoxy-L-arabinose transferase-like glycosyltransferase